MKPQDLHPSYQTQIENIRKLATSASHLFVTEAQSALVRAENGVADTREMLALLHDMQRLNIVALGGLENNAAFKTAITAEKAPHFRDYTAPPAADHLQQGLADKLYNIRAGHNDTGLIRIGDGAGKIGPMLFEKTRAAQAPCVVRFHDSGFDALALNHTDAAGIEKIAGFFNAQVADVTRVMTCLPGLPQTPPTAAAPEKAQVFRERTKAFGEKISSGDVFYTLTVIPTEKDAAVDGIAYDDYVTLFFEMIDQPWPEIDAAQQKLIAEFNTASTVRITNNDGTDISMSLIDADGSHFTFCNSLIAKNVPGSEFFSAPRRDSVNGKIVAKGKFEHDERIIENLTLEFEKGKLVRYAADKGLDVFESALIDDGAYYIGELGIGTNPHLKTHVANGLLVEKIGGSFHVALGKCYTYTNYEGVDVKVDNGNKSKLHWDITTMLHGKEGRIFLDDRLVMDNGKWIDPAYDVLNRGWAAIPREKRPKYWQQKYG